MGNLNKIALENLGHSIKLLFTDDFCEEVECNTCPFYVKAKGEIDGEDCLYICDFLFQIKERL